MLSSDKWQPCSSRLYDRMRHQLHRSGVYLERSGSFDVEQTWYVMDVPLLKTRRGAPRAYWYNPEFSWDFNVKAPIDFILPVKKRNPPKMDRVVARYAERVYKDIITAIRNKNIPCDVLRVPDYKRSSPHMEVEYYIQLGHRPINLFVDSKCSGGDIFVPDDDTKPVKITVYGWGIPDQAMFVHEFVHYLQSKHGIFHGTARHTEVAAYLDQSNERDAYFIQFLTSTNLNRVKDPARTIKNYFSKNGLWQAMKPQTRTHLIDRFTTYIEHIRGS